MSTWWEQFWTGLSGDFTDLPDGAAAGQIVGRVLVAAILGGILGYEREQKGKAAGMRTHILVAVAAAFFVAVPQQAGLSSADVSRVIQGVAAGIGFLGAGTILKSSDQAQVLGLTTAANLYFTTAIGVAAGMGREVSAIVGTLLALAVLNLVPRLETWFFGTRKEPLAPVDGPTVAQSDPPPSPGHAPVAAPTNRPGKKKRR